MEDTKFKTKDLPLAAFLKVKGHSYTVERDKGLGVFLFDESVKPIATDFYKNKESFLAFANAIKDLKREIKSI